MVHGHCMANICSHLTIICTLFRDDLQLSIFSKRRTTFFSVGGWVRVKKSIFLVFFSPNSNIPRYVSYLDNIIHDHHFICSHDILFKYKNVFIKYPYDALFKYVRQKGFFVYLTWWNKITNQNEINIESFIVFNKFW